MTDLFDARVVRRAPSIRARQFGADGILLDPASGEFLQVNDVGLAIWFMLDAPACIDDLVSRLAADYAVTPDAAAPDVREFVAALVERRFVEIDAS